MRRTNTSRTKPQSRLTVRKRQAGGPHFARLTDSVNGDYFRVPPSEARPKRVFVNCHYCGYAPAHGLIPKTGLCPKCGSMSWDRFALAEPLVPKHMK
ncbi:MAG: hypothetical protein SVV80_09055 [Planctomycetota bacterium]|nr:hypothetical protein [Planctomycetota bacterium]